MCDNLCYYFVNNDTTAIEIRNNACVQAVKPPLLHLENHDLSISNGNISLQIFANVFALIAVFIRQKGKHPFFSKCMLPCP